MKRVEQNDEWSLFCPNEEGAQACVHGIEFEALFIECEKEGRTRKTALAQKLWHAILESVTLTVSG